MAHSQPNYRLAREYGLALEKNLGSIIRGQGPAIRLLLAAYFNGGHVLIEDVPGTGKTTLAKALARSIQCPFSRIQFTPDMLPSDILGVSIFNPRDQAFVFHKGPVFTSILLADEINRASPRTQSALLEAMAEGQVSIDGARHRLPADFFVMATQNPVEFQGTYPLPEAQMDRFDISLCLGYLGHDEELALLENHGRGQCLDHLQACLDAQKVLMVRESMDAIRVHPSMLDYIVNLVSATRHDENIKLGASPRASLAMLNLARGLALLDGLEFVTPAHIQTLALPVLAHRIMPQDAAKYAGQNNRSLITGILKSIPVPPVSG